MRLIATFPLLLLELLLLVELPWRGYGFIRNDASIVAKRRVALVGSSSSSSSSLELLRETVELLGRDPRTGGGCHWVEEQDVSSVAQFLREELGEVEEALEAAATVGTPPSAAATRALLSECGDVLWNAMLLCHVAGRVVKDAEEFAGEGSTIDSAAAMAAEKIRRRTPYIAEWGVEKYGEGEDTREAPSSRAASRAEAESAWNTAKAAEGA
jgi:NTP pyrophosphatase (non-canonical NTP hydrolase)